MRMERAETAQRRWIGPCQAILAACIIFLSLGLSPSLLMAAPGYGGVQTSKSGINRSSFSVRYDQLGLTIGDVLVVSVTTDHSNAGSIIVQGSGHPGGVTVYNADSTASGRPRLRVDVLVYDGSWPSTLDYRFSVSDSETWIAYATKWSGVDTGNPVAASAGLYEGVTASPTSPALTAPEDGLTAVAVYGAREDDFDSNGAPAGYTPIGIGASNIGSTGSSSGVAYQAGISSGTVPAAIWTQAAATPAHAVHLLLRGANGVPTAAAPTFTPVGGTVTDSVTVTLSSTTSTASIYYTTDNSTPTRSSMFYGGPFTLTGSATVKAIAMTDGFNDSVVASATYTVTASGGGGGSPAQYGGVQTSKSGINRSSFSVRYDQLGLTIGDVLVVSVTTDHSNAGSIIIQGSGHPGGVTVYNADSTASGRPRLRVDVLVYDGSWPSTLDYRFSVSDSETWIAYATRWSGVDTGNPVAASVGLYEGVTANPTSPALTASEDGLTAVAIYGAREDDFDSNGAPVGYTSIGIGASNIGKTGSSSGIAYQAGISSGSVPAAIWTQAAATPAHAVHLLLRGANGGTTPTPTAAAPTFTPAGGTVTDSVTVTLSSTTSTASIYYTTDNSTPTRSSMFYGGPVTLTRSATVKAIAMADGFNDSVVASETYTVTASGGGGGNLQYGGLQTSKSGINRGSFSVGYDQLGLAIGDVLVVSVTTDHSNAGSIIVQGSGHPGGVTVYNADSTASGRPRLRVDVLVYDGSWPSTLNYRFSVSDSETWIAYATRWSGVDTGNPVAASAGLYEGVTANPTSPALTAPEDGLTAVAIYGAREDDFDSNGAPAGYTPIGIGASNIGKTGSSSGIAHQAGISSGAVPAAIWTQAAATPAHAVHLLLRGANGVPTAALHSFNEALYATPTVSSTSSAKRQYHANDGIDTVASNGWVGTENVSTGTSWIRLTFDSTKTIYRVVLTDLIGPTAQLEAGSIEFSDGSSVTISTPLADDGTPQEFVFAPEQTDWVQINLTRATGNYGLTEIAAYSALDTNQVRQAEDLFNDGNAMGWTVVDNCMNTGSSSAWDPAFFFWNGAGNQYRQTGNCRGFSQEGVEMGTYARLDGVVTTGMDLRLRLRSDDTGATWVKGAMGVLFGYQNDNNYYRLDISQVDGHRKLWKKKAGVFNELISSPQSYTPGAWTNLRVVQKNGVILVYMNGEKVLAVEDTAFSGGQIALFCARNESCSFDNVVLLAPPDTPIVGANIADGIGHKSGEYFVDAGGILDVAAVVTSSIGFDSVEFVVDEGLPGEISLSDFTVPYKRTFNSLPAGEHAVRTYLINAAGQRLSDAEAMVELPQVAINGIHLVGLGDSISFGMLDDVANDDISIDGRNTGGGYQSVLNNALTDSNLKPVTVLNEGNPGETSGEAASRINAVLARTPAAQAYLAFYGANDSGGSIPLSKEIFKGNMQTIIDAVRAAGKDIYLAKAPPDLRAGHGGRDALIQEYNVAIQELVDNPANGFIGYTSPDFHAFFTNMPEQMADGLHPNGEGYQSMARLWCEGLNGQAGMVCIP